MLRLRCPACGRDVLADEACAGLEVACPACGAGVAAPGLGPRAADIVGEAPAPASPSPRARVPDPVAAGESSQATLAFVLGLLGFACFPAGPVALFVAMRHRRRARAAGREPDGRATFGGLLGLVATALWSIAAVGGLFAAVSVVFEDMRK